MQHALIDPLVVVQSGLAQSYAGLVPPLVYLADDMVRDVDPQVCFPGQGSALLLSTVLTLFLLARPLYQNLLREHDLLSECYCLLAPVFCTQAQEQLLLTWS